MNFNIYLDLNQVKIYYSLHVMMLDLTTIMSIINKDIAKI